MRITLALALVPAVLLAQEPDVRAQLQARGLSAAAIDEIVVIAADATARGLPTGPLVDKAIEGHAKGVPVARIAAALREFAGRMGDGRDAVRAAGVDQPPGEVVAAAAEALGRGVSGEQVASVVRAAPRPPMAAPGLRVATALAAQGLGADQAVGVVVEALRAGQTVTQLLDLPSVMSTMQAQGMTPPEIGRRMLRGEMGRPDAPGRRVRDVAPRPLVPPAHRPPPDRPPRDAPTRP